MLDQLAHAKEGFLFDLDGTLIDGAPDIANALNYVLNARGWQAQSMDAIGTWIGNGTQKLVERALTAIASQENAAVEAFIAAHQQAVHDAYVARYTEHCVVDTFIFDGVVEFLDYLKNKQAKLACVTNKPSPLTYPVLEKLNLAHYFDEVVCMDEVPKAKPAPEHVWHAQTRLGLPVDACVMIGDSKNDIIAAQRAGMESIAVTYGFNHGEDIRASEPTLVVSSMRELIPSSYEER